MLMQFVRYRSQLTKISPSFAAQQHSHGASRQLPSSLLQHLHTRDERAVRVQSLLYDLYAVRGPQSGQSNRLPKLSLQDVAKGILYMERMGGEKRPRVRVTSLEGETVGKHNATLIQNQSRRETKVTPLKNNSILDYGLMQTEQQVWRAIALSPEQSLSLTQFWVSTGTVKGSPRKLAQLGRQIHLLSLRDGLDQMHFSCRQLARHVHRALTFAVTKSVTCSLNASRLLIQQCVTCQKPMFKRLRIHARGRMGVVHLRYAEMKIQIRQLAPDETWESARAKSRRAWQKLGKVMRADKMMPVVHPLARSVTSY